MVWLRTPNARPFFGVKPLQNGFGTPSLVFLGLATKNAGVSLNDAPDDRLHTGDVLGVWRRKRRHFKPILDATPIGQRVTPQQFAELKVLYETYCTNTDWPLPSRPVGFGTMLEQFETKCFSVEFADGSKGRFSLDKALSAVAK